MRPLKLPCRKNVFYYFYHSEILFDKLDKYISYFLPKFLIGGFLYFVIRFLGSL